jgi:hypothetical protein
MATLDYFFSLIMWQLGPNFSQKQIPKPNFVRLAPSFLTTLGKSFSPKKKEKKKKKTLVRTHLIGMPITVLLWILSQHHM